MNKTAIQIFSKAMNMSEQEMFKMMKDGKLLATDVLPKVAKVMKDMANNGGALAAKLQTVRVQQGRFFNELDFAQKKVFDSGFDKGLAGLFQTMTDGILGDQETLERIGKIFKKVFEAITLGVRGASNALESIVRAVDSVYSAFKFMVDNNPFLTMGLGIASVTAGVRILSAAFGGLGAAIMKALKLPMVIIMTIVGLLDEIRAVFDENLIGAGENDKASAEDRKIAAVNAKVKMTGGTKEQREYLSKFSQDRILQAQENSGGLASLIPSGTWGQGVKNASSNFVDFSTNLSKDVSLGLLDAYSKNSLGGFVFNQSITVQGDMDGPSAQKVADQTKKGLNEMASMNTAVAR